MMKSVFLLQYELSRTQRKYIFMGTLVCIALYKIPRAQNLSFLNFRRSKHYSMMNLKFNIQRLPNQDNEIANLFPLSLSYRYTVSLQIFGARKYQKNSSGHLTPVLTQNCQMLISFYYVHNHTIEIDVQYINMLSFLSKNVHTCIFIYFLFFTAF